VEETGLREQFGYINTKQQQRTRQKSGVRAAVEHPFAFLQKKWKTGLATAKTKMHNALWFDLHCIIYNVLRKA
jgi:ribosome-associated toxin RatA of RatAB toxin-antitoxin module